MTAEDMRQELERSPFVPLRLHLAGGQVIEIPYAGTAWVRQNTIVVVYPIAKGSAAIGNYDVISSDSSNVSNRIPKLQRRSASRSSAIAAFRSF